MIPKKFKISPIKTSKITTQGLRAPLTTSQIPQRCTADHCLNDKQGVHGVWGAHACRHVSFKLGSVGCPVIFRISPGQGMSKVANTWLQKEDFFPLEDLDTGANT